MLAPPPYQRTHPFKPQLGLRNSDQPQLLACWLPLVWYADTTQKQSGLAASVGLHASWCGQSNYMHLRLRQGLCVLMHATLQVVRVHYPGLQSHLRHALVQELFSGRGSGGMLAFEVRDGATADAVLKVRVLLLPNT